MQAETANVIRDGEEVQVSVDEVEVGDIMLVRLGENVLLDGAIVEGRSNVDEPMVTGESDLETKE